MGEPRRAMAEALAAMDGHERIALWAVSPLYRTEPWGKPDQPDFLNAVACVTTSLDPRDLLAFCLSVERQSGRVRGERWGPRTLDIDILVFGDEKIDKPGLTVPHPNMTERGFVMVPLADLAPDMMVEGRSASDWARGLSEGVFPTSDEAPDWWKVG